MKGLHQTCRVKLTRYVNDLYRPNLNMDIPHCLHFSQLALTLDQHSRENDIPIPGDNEKDGKGGVYEVDEYSDSDDEELFYDDQDDDVNEVGDGGCGFCGSNHKYDDCIKAITFSIMKKILTHTPAKLEGILKK